jgi:hypothetical protein
VENASSTQEGLTLEKWDKPAVDVHLGVTTYCREVLVRIEVAVRAHSLPRQEVDDAEEALVYAAERAITCVSFRQRHILAPARCYARNLHAAAAFLQGSKDRCLSYIESESGSRMSAVRSAALSPCTGRGPDRGRQGTLAVSLAPLVVAEDALAQPQTLGGNLEKLVVGNEVERLLETQNRGRREPDQNLGGGRPDVRLLLVLADVDHDVVTA